MADMAVSRAEEVGGVPAADEHDEDSSLLLDELRAA